MDDPLTLTQGANSFYYHKDGLGSVVNLTDNSGNLVKSYIYKSFGEIYSETGSVVQPFTFTGREYDPESGLYYYRARYYDPRAGRFLTKDPIGFVAGDVNLYRYVTNNAVNWIDPLGLDFASNYTGSLRATNNFFFQWPTELTKTGLGLITAGAIAETFGAVTPLQGIRSLPAGGIANLGVLGTIGSAVLNTGLNVLFSSIALEGGIGFGSLISAIPVYDTDKTITDWWADFWWKLLHDRRSGACR